MEPLASEIAINGGLTVERSLSSVIWDPTWIVLSIHSRLRARVTRTVERVESSAVSPTSGGSLSKWNNHNHLHRCIVRLRVVGNNTSVRWSVGSWSRSAVQIVLTLNAIAINFESYSTFTSPRQSAMSFERCLRPRSIGHQKTRLPFLTGDTPVCICSKIVTAWTDETLKARHPHNLNA